MASAPPPASPSSAVPFPLDDDDDEDNNLASLMPHFCNMLNDDTITELEFQDIHRFLSQETSKGKVLTPKGSSLANHPLKTYCKRKDRDVDKEGLEVSQTSPPSARPEYPEGKENAVSRKVPRRNTVLRREGSDRITSHRTFKVDLRSFGSILNNGILGDSQIPCDVHAFWEAEDEREASDAIMRKLQGEAEPCSQQSLLGNSRLRRPCARRKGSQRRTKSRGITLDLPLYAKQMQSLDDEHLEEEDVNLDTYSFVKNSELEMKDDMHINKNIAIPSKHLQHVFSDLIHSDMVKSSISPPDETEKPPAQMRNDDDMQIVLSDEESHDLHTGQCMLNQKDSPVEKLKGLPTLLQPSDKLQVTFDDPTAAPVDSPAGDKEDGHNKEEAEIVLERHAEEAGVFVNSSGHDEEEAQIDAAAVPVSMSAANKTEGQVEEQAEVVSWSAAHEKEGHAEEDEEGCVVAAIKATPYEKHELIKKTPLTSPTPPSNPLAVLGFQKDISPEGIGKRKLDFDSTIDDPLQESTLLTSTGKDSPCLEKSSPGSGKSAQENSPTLRKETTLRKGNKSVSFDGVVDVTTGVTTHHTRVKKLHLKKGGMKKNTVNRRGSLSAFGTKWDNGVRRSTRIRSRPLDFWRGERFLYGRVHTSLLTVIGIKYSSPPPCWPRRQEECPKFKVESFVSEKFANYVRFAALG